MNGSGLCVRTLGQLFEIEVDADFIHKLIWAHAVEGFKKSVVVHNCQVVCGVKKSHKVVKGLFTCVGNSCLQVSFTALFANVVSWSSSVMTVANVKIGNFFKLFLEPLRVLGRAPPKHVANTIIGGNITVRFALWDLVYSSRYSFLVFSESQEYGASVSVLNISELGAVFFFLGKSVLMLLNAVLFIVLDAG